MLKNTVSIEEFRVNLADLVGQVMYGKDRVIIRKYNKDAAVLLSLEDYEKLLDPTKRLSKIEWVKAAQKLAGVRNKLPQSGSKRIEREIKKAVQDVRAKKRNYTA